MESLKIPYKILDRRMKNGRIQYQVEWSGKSSEPTWEQRKTLKEDGHMKLIKDYETIQKNNGISSTQMNLVKTNGKLSQKKINTINTTEINDNTNTTIKMRNQLRTPSPTKTTGRGRTSYSTTSKGKSPGRRGRASISKGRASLSGRSSMSVTRRNRLSVSAPKLRTSRSRTRRTNPNKKKTDDEKLLPFSTPERKKLTMYKSRDSNSSPNKRVNSISPTRNECVKSPISNKEEILSKDEKSTSTIRPYRGEYKMLQKYFFKRSIWADIVFVSIIVIATIASTCASVVLKTKCRNVQAYCGLVAISALLIESLRRKDTSTKAKALQICLTWRLVSDSIGIEVLSVQETFSDVISFLRTISNLAALTSTLLLAFPKSHKFDIVVLLPSILGTILLFLMDFLEIFFDNHSFINIRSPLTIFALIILVVSLVVATSERKKHHHHHHHEHQHTK